MAITIAVTGMPTVTLNETQITIGSHSSCNIAIPGCSEIRPLHALIREVDGQWIIESCKNDLIVVGQSDPGIEHPLHPGDVIRLSETCPIITFQPATDDFLPSISGDESDQFRLLPLDDRPSSSATIPSRPPSSGSIPAKKGGSSGQIRTTKSPSSTSIPATGAKSSDKIRVPKPPSSTSIPAQRPRSSGTMRTVDPSLTQSSDGQSTPTKRSDASPPARKSDASLPTSGPRRSRSSGQIPVHKPTADDDQPVGVPVLQRSSSWQEDLPPAPRRGRSSQKEEMEWIMMVVGRCAAGGAAFLVCWLVVSTAWKALSPAVPTLPSELTSSTLPSPTEAAAPVTEVAPYVPPRPKPAPAVKKPEPPAGEVISAATVGTPDTKTTVDSPESTSANGSAQVNIEKSNPDLGGEILARVDADANMPPTNIEAAVENDAEDPEEALSPLQLAVMDGVYAIMAEDATGKRSRQLGTAWAASERHFVTSATVARAIEESRRQHRIAFAIHPTSQRKIRIGALRMHPNFRRAVQVADEAEQRSNEKQFSAALKIQIRCDIAVLDIEPTEPLETSLPFVSTVIRAPKDATFNMVGFPFDKSSQKLNQLAEIGPLKERHSRQSSSSQIQNKDHTLAIQFAVHANDSGWAGSPVLDQNNQVIGVYAYIQGLKNIDPKKVRSERAVVWLGLLRDFAPDLESKGHENAD